MKIAEPKPADVGVVIGRFQLHELHEGHKDLLDTVASRHRKMIVLIGIAPVADARNPLDFESRARMVQDHLPRATCLPVRDCETNTEWSALVDQAVQIVLAPGQTAQLYGSRDSFIPAYGGRFRTTELAPAETFAEWSGTAAREEAAKSIRPTADFRAGVIWAMTNRYPAVVSTVDIAVIDRPTERLLMIKKAAEGMWRLPGGFCEPSAASHLDDAKRELREECGGIEVGNWFSLGSAKVDDWRYRKSVDRIRTNLYVADYVFGNPVAGDDAAVADWVTFERLDDPKFPCVVPEHRELVKAVRDYGRFGRL